MADFARYIEVIAHTKVNRRVESYQTEIQINVSNRKKSRHSCFKDSLKLRDEVIAALSKADISDENIQEGGGDHAWYYNDNWKSISHRLLASHSDISTLIKAMAKVEQAFSNSKESFFSPIKKTLSLSAPQPKFSGKNGVTDHSLKAVIVEAREKANFLAAEAGLQVSGVLTIVEEPQSISGKFAGENFSDADELMDVSSGENYTVVSQQRRSTSRRFRVRFAVSESKIDA